MYNSTWVTPLMILIAALVILFLAPFALLLSFIKVRDANQLGINLKMIAQFIVGMSKTHKPTSKLLN